MVINPNLFYKTLVIGIIFLFIGVGIQPAIATVQPKEKIIIDSPIDYLFETVIDIANNPDVRDLLEQNENEIFKVNIDRSIYRKILFKNPILFFNLLFTKPTDINRYLNKCYKMGNKIINIIGEDKTLKILESVEVTDTEIFDELDEIIKNDEILSNKLTTLEEFNKELYPATPTLDGPIMFAILMLLLVPLLIALSVLGVFNFWTEGEFLIFMILEIILWEIYWRFFHDLTEQ
ncbi:MAG: hypothetical protein JSU91_08410 [Thermoplasmatales archaeon]|nr:MAG: hypothetical protein JSU91_08410 [Thermoplasmatales archaeon]